MKRWMRKLHKWIGIGIGVLFAVWLISGIVMVLPWGLRPAYQGPSGPGDYSAVRVSPADAVAAVVAEAGDAVVVRNLQLIRLRDGFAYHLTLRRLGTRLVDAKSGAVITITAELAEQLARDEYATDAPVGTVRLMEKRDPSYAYGPMPAWRVSFADDRNTVSYVATTDGSVRRADRASRVRNAIVSTHSFSTLGILRIGKEIQHQLLILTSIIGLGAVITGYYLTLPNSWLRRRRERAVPAPERLPSKVAAS